MRTLTQAEYDTLKGCVGNHCYNDCVDGDEEDSVLQALLERGLMYSVPCFNSDDEHYITNGRGKMVMQLFNMMQDNQLLTG